MSSADILISRECKSNDFSASGEGMVNNWLRRLTVIFLLGAVSLFGQSAASARTPQSFTSLPQPAPAAQADILDYIHNTWDTLRRSMNECSSVVDPKLGVDAQTVLYLPSAVVAPSEVADLGKKCQVRVQRLPEQIMHLGEVMPGQLPIQGLLFLPNPYVVPGGRFNEMYGWDSYFIIRGLLEDGRRDLARGMVENFFYEIENYGAVLNANRTYYLTRSQPPFLTSMVMAQYAADKAAGLQNREWLARAYQYAKRDYALWTHAPKLAGSTGLSRYFDVGEGPVPEVADHPEYYANVADWLVRHPQVYTGYLAPTPIAGIGPELRVPLCGERPCVESRLVRFTAAYYKGDRAMRESGFDISFRFGPFGGSAHHYAPVCLNSLLYKAEVDLAEMARLLGTARKRSGGARRPLPQEVGQSLSLESGQGDVFRLRPGERSGSTYDY